MLSWIKNAAIVVGETVLKTMVVIARSNELVRILATEGAEAMAIAIMEIGQSMFKPPDHQNPTNLHIFHPGNRQIEDELRRAAERQAELQAEDDRKRKEDQDNRDAEEQKKQAKRDKVQKDFEAKQKQEKEDLEQKKQDNKESLKKAEAAQQERLRKEFEEQQKQHEERLKEQWRKHEETLKREAEAENLRNQEREERLKAEDRQREEEHRAAKEKLERLREALNKGITPILDPTEEELSAAQARLLGVADRFHCAVAGNSGSGKSSLINALRGVPDGNARAAAVGVTETTMKITAYPDSSADPPRNRFVWYDIPGAGTLTIPGPVYFNSQGLFVFDLIIVMVDVRFTTQDLAILENCVHFKIPSFIVRSKADQHIHNIIRAQLQTDPEDDASGDEAFDISELGGFDLAALYKVVGAARCEEAKKTLVTQTRNSFRQNLLNHSQLDPDQKVYIVSADLLRQFATRMSQKKVAGKFKNLRYLIDEGDLVGDLLKAIRARRYDAHTMEG